MFLPGVRAEVEARLGGTWLTGSGRVVDADTGTPSWRTAIFGIEGDRILKVVDRAHNSADDAAAMRLLFGRLGQVATPELLDEGELSSGDHWLLMNRLPGEPVQNTVDNDALATTSGLAFVEACGEVAGAVASIPVERWGSLTSGATQWSIDRIDQGSERTYRDALAAGGGDADHVARLRRTQAKLLDEVESRRFPRLVHGDLGTGNLFGRLHGRRWKLHALIDFERSHGGYPEEDCAWTAFAGHNSPALARYLHGFQSVNDTTLSSDVVTYFTIAVVMRLYARPGRSPWLDRHSRLVGQAIAGGS